MATNACTAHFVTSVTYPTTTFCNIPAASSLTINCIAHFSAVASTASHITAYYADVILSS